MSVDLDGVDFKTHDEDIEVTGKTVLGNEQILRHDPLTGLRIPRCKNIHECLEIIFLASIATDMTKLTQQH